MKFNPAPLFVHLEKILKSAGRAIHTCMYVGRYRWNLRVVNYIIPEINSTSHAFAIILTPPRFGENES